MSRHVWGRQCHHLYLSAPSRLLVIKIHIRSDNAYTGSIQWVCRICIYLKQLLLSDRYNITKGQVQHTEFVNKISSWLGLQQDVVNNVLVTYKNIQHTHTHTHTHIHACARVRTRLVRQCDIPSMPCVSSEANPDELHIFNHLAVLTPSARKRRQKWARDRPLDPRLALEEGKPCKPAASQVWNDREDVVTESLWQSLVLLRRACLQPGGFGTQEGRRNSGGE